MPIVASGGEIKAEQELADGESICPVTDPTPGSP